MESFLALWMVAQTENYLVDWKDNWKVVSRADMTEAKLDRQMVDVTVVMKVC